jgi:hypothetical protein
MSSENKVPVTVRSISSEPVSVAISLRQLSKHERVVLSLKGLGLFWGLAALSVFIPVMHFILVPMFLLLGPLIAYLNYQKTVFLGDTVVTCPNCSERLHLKNGTARWPHEEVCGKCRAKIYFGS